MLVLQPTCNSCTAPVRPSYCVRGDCNRLCPQSIRFPCTRPCAWRRSRTAEIPLESSPSTFPQHEQPSKKLRVTVSHSCVSATTKIQSANTVYKLIPVPLDGSVTSCSPSSVRADCTKPQYQMPPCNQRTFLNSCVAVSPSAVPNASNVTQLGSS